MSESSDPATHSTPPRSSAVTRIAVGVDRYPESSDAVVLAAAIAHVTGAELMLVAVDPKPRFVLPKEIDGSGPEQQTAATLDEAHDSFAPEARTVVETDVSIPRALQRVVHREHCDLLVMGSSRHAPEGRVRIGRRTRQLLSSVECALAIAPRGIHSSPRRGFARIGVGYDGGPESESALALASSLALAAGAELQVCAVVDDRVPPIGWSALARGGAGLPRWEEAVLAELDRLRGLTRERTQAIGARAHAEVVRGRPADALRKLSEEMDLLVIGSRRWGPVARLLLGSTGEALARDAGCPLLVAPRAAT